MNSLIKIFQDRFSRTKSVFRTKEEEDLDLLTELEEKRRLRETSKKMDSYRRARIYGK